MDGKPYGARFIDEMRRLTRSSWGLEYRQMQRLAAMDRDEFMAALGLRVAPAGGAAGDPDTTSEPELLARKIVEQGRSSDFLTDVVNILGGFA
jgi:hypothetical protein